jgi:hypothetical protein
LLLRGKRKILGRLQPGFFARKAEEATYRRDEEYWGNASAGVLYNEQARPVAGGLRDHELYLCKSLVNVWCEGDNRLPNMRLGSVAIADNDEAAAMIDYRSDMCVRGKRAGRVMLEVPVRRVVRAQDSALVAERIHSV